MAKLDELISSLNGTPFQIAGFVRTSDSVECQYFGPEDLKDTVMDSVLKMKTRPKWDSCDLNGSGCKNSNLWKWLNSQLFSTFSCHRIQYEIGGFRKRIFLVYRALLKSCHIIGSAQIGPLSWKKGLNLRNCCIRTPRESTQEYHPQGLSLRGALRWISCQKTSQI